MAEHYVIGVVGNPNCGKTTLFNALTGTKQRVGNWPGVTVEQKVGNFIYQAVEFELVDLPGTYSLDVAEGDVSVDEQIARNYVASRAADVIINIVDASNLERNLYLTSQLLEMAIPTVVVLNMMDVAAERGIKIDCESLSQHLGCPVLPVVAAKGEGISELNAAILQLARAPHAPEFTLPYPTAIESAITDLTPAILEHAQQQQLNSRWLALRLLEGDPLAQQHCPRLDTAVLAKKRANTEQALEDDIDIIVADSRYRCINDIVKTAVRQQGQLLQSLSDKIDRVVLNRILGIPIFLVVMYLMFLFTINIGSAFIDFFDILFGTIFVDGSAYLLTALGVPDAITALIANGIGGGIQTVATFIPVIGCLFLFLSWLEDSGYMARAAFVMDRFMRFIGLPGKAFVPMLVGFGCNVPAIMATRTLENQRDRQLAILMNPFMSCGARLPVYALFAAAFFPVGGQNLVFGLYLLGIGVAVFTGLIMKNTILQGHSTPFVMELPPYHMPTLKGILLRTWERLKSFIIKAGRVIVPMVLILNFLNAMGTNGTFGHEDSQDSVLSEIGRAMSPVFAPMGLDEENWPATVGIFTGVLAKEAVVGTLDALYSELAAPDDASDEDAFNLWGGIREAVVSVRTNMGDIASALFDPLGLNIGDISSADEAASEQEVHVGTFGMMQARFDGQVGAFAYLLFILLYFPCAAATAAVAREAGMAWAAFVATWTTGLAYGCATLFYQVARFSQHPASSSAWIAGILLVFAVVLLILRWWGRQASTKSPQLSLATS